MPEDRKSLIPRSIPVEQIEFSASAMKSRHLPLAVFGGLFLEVNVNHDNGATAPTAEDFWRNIIKSLDIVLNGQDNIIRIPFEFLLHMNTLEQQVAPLTSVDLSTSSTVDSYGHFYLPFELLNAVIPRDTLLDARKLSSCVLNIHWGAAADLTNITAINSATVGIQTDEFANVPDPFKVARHEYSYEEILLDAVGDIQYHLATRGTNQYRRVWILALDGSTPRVLSNVELTNLKVSARSFVYYDAAEDRNRAQQYKMFDRAALTGVYCIDFTRWGLMTQRIDATEMSELTLTIKSAVTDAKAVIISEKVIYEKPAKA